MKKSVEVLRSRDHWIGWSDEQRRCRLALIANNSRFLILAQRRELPNLASRVMRLCLARLSEIGSRSVSIPSLWLSLSSIRSFFAARLTRPPTALSARALHGPA
jgi:hypothetical protein